MKTFVHILSSHSAISRMRNVSDKCCIEIQKKYFMFNKCFVENHTFCEIMWSNVVQREQATDGNMAHAQYMMYTYGYKHKIRICNTYCFSTATMVTRTHLNVTLYVYCLSCC
jgi:hypothetical protein